MARDYRVELDIYNGPLDLLLYLIRRDELDIYDIHISEITEQFLNYLELIQKLDLSVAGDFLVMASTLMQIKTRMLLPQPETEDEEEEDPRMELVRQLIEYRKFKEAAGHLGDRRREQAKLFPRVGEDWARDEPQDESGGLHDVDLWTLLDAFTRLMKETLGDSDRIIVDDETPVRDHMVEVIETLAGPGQMRFEEMFRGRRDRGYMIGIFLALLELVRQRRIQIRQDADFGAIVVVLVNADVKGLIIPEDEADAVSVGDAGGVGDTVESDQTHDPNVPGETDADGQPMDDGADGSPQSERPSQEPAEEPDSQAAPSHFDDVPNRPDPPPSGETD